MCCRFEGVSGEAVKKTSILFEVPKGLHQRPQPHHLTPPPPPPPTPHHQRPQPHHLKSLPRPSINSCGKKRK